MSKAAVLGIIAGGGILPARLAAACRSVGRAFFVLGLKGFADTDFLKDGEPYAWNRLGAVDAGLQLLHQHGVRDVVLAGSVRRPGFAEIRPDKRGAFLLAKLAFNSAGDDGVLRLLVEEIEREGFSVIGVDEVLAQALAPRGVMGSMMPDRQAQSDIRYGVRVVLALGDLDVGQGAVVQQGVVLAVEAIEGTDAMLSRCAQLMRVEPGGVLVKMKKPRQDRRVDLPAIGVRTIEAAAAAGLRGVAVQAGEALVLDKGDVLSRADELGMFVCGISPDV